MLGIRSIAMCLACLLISLGAKAQELRAPSLTAYIDGGIPADEFAALFKQLVDDQGQHLVPLTAYTVKPGDNICGILNSQFKIDSKHCGRTLITAIANLNQGLQNPDALRVDQSLKLPELKVQRFPKTYSFDMGNPDEKGRLTTLKANWVILDEKEFVRFAGTKREKRNVELTLEGYRIEFRLDRIDVVTAKKGAVNLGEGNMSIFVDSGVADPKASYAIDITPDELRRRCEARESNVDHLQASYAALTEYPYAEHLPAPVCNKLCNGEECRSRVVIIDKPIPLNSDLPALETLKWCAKAVEGPQPVPPAIKPNDCGQMGFSEETDHAVHMAGIIASRDDNNIGFSGVDTKARLCSFHWTKNTSANDLIRSVFNDKFPRNPELPEPQIVLFASNFKDEETAGQVVVQRQDATYGTESLRLSKTGTDSQKLNYELAINDKRLWVVSAGQNESPVTDVTGFGVGVLSQMSPQNLGDKKNVLVVTACSGCKDDAAVIWERANFSQPRQHMVHVAAPGGDPIFGLSSIGLGEAEGGTSQAAAYVAGVASKLMRCHKDFDDAEVAKQRLILTSTPQLRESDWDKLSGGVVSPELAMLNPYVTWAKFRDGGFGSFTKVAWCQTSARLDTDHLVDFKKVRRIYRMVNSSVELKDRMVVFTNEKGDISKLDPGKFEIVAQTPQVKLWLEDGTTITRSLDAIDDLILSDPEFTDISFGCD